jgi:hypothetical protein
MGGHCTKSKSQTNSLSQNIIPKDVIDKDKERDLSSIVIGYDKNVAQQNHENYIQEIIIGRMNKKQMLIPTIQFNINKHILSRRTDEIKFNGMTSMICTHTQDVKSCELCRHFVVSESKNLFEPVKIHNKTFVPLIDEIVEELAERFKSEWKIEKEITTKQLEGEYYCSKTKKNKKSSCIHYWIILRITPQITQKVYESSETCIACMDAKSEKFLTSCKHLCLCLECFNGHVFKECPICRYPCEN